MEGSSHLSPEMLALVHARMAQLGDPTGLAAIDALLAELATYRVQLLTGQTKGVSIVDPFEPTGDPQTAMADPFAPAGPSPVQARRSMTDVSERLARRMRDAAEQIRERQEGDGDPDDDDPDDDSDGEGGGGVREPRRPLIGPDSGSVALQPPTV